METLKIFVQGEGLSQIEVVDANSGDSVQTVLEKAKGKGLIYMDESTITQDIVKSCG